MDFFKKMWRIWGHGVCLKVFMDLNTSLYVEIMLSNWWFRIVVLEKTLESPLACKEIKPVNPKENQPWIFIGQTDAEAEAPVLWPPDAKSWLIGKDPDAGRNWGQDEKRATEDEGWIASLTTMDMSLSKLWEMVDNREAWHATVHGVTKSRSWLSNWTTQRQGNNSWEEWSV